MKGFYSTCKNEIVMSFPVTPTSLVQSGSKHLLSEKHQFWFDIPRINFCLDPLQIWQGCFYIISWKTANIFGITSSYCI